MSWGTLNTENTLNRLLLKDWVTKARSNVREFHVLSPLYIVLRAFAMVVMVSCWSIFEVLLEVNFLSLREPGSCWLSPSVVVFKEHVIEMLVSLPRVINLIKVSWNIANFIKVIGADLADMHIYHEAVVCVNLKQFVLSKTLSLHPLANVNLFMRQHNLGMSLIVTRSLHIGYFQVSFNFVFVNFEVEVLFSGNFVVGSCSNTSLLLLRDLILKAKELKLLFNNLVDLCLDRVQVRMIALNLLKLAEYTLLGAALF
mmetsp:Transcript_32515/g.23495  ORF Transcript_32515/g.23495 Transcript_32515/m.23495 type:complete len:256 (+) Transcript_32515:984-1751(+)